MVRISKLTDYAVLLLYQLASSASRGDEPLLTARDLAERTGMPMPTVSKLLKLMTRGELLVSIRGAKGGYRLARPAAEISLGEILQAVEGPVALTACTEGKGQCARQAECGARSGWSTVNQVVRGTLDRMTLQALVETAPRARTRGKSQTKESMHP